MLGVALAAVLYLFWLVPELPLPPLSDLVLATSYTAILFSAWGLAEGILILYGRSAGPFCAISKRAELAQSRRQAARMLKASLAHLPGGGDDQELSELNRELRHFLRDGDTEGALEAAECMGDLLGASSEFWDGLRQAADVVELPKVSERYAARAQRNLLQ